MNFRSGQSGSVVKKGATWHGRYWVDVPGIEKRQRKSVPLGAVSSMTKPQAKRQLRALLEEMGLNQDSHLERTQSAVRTFADEATWWRENHLSVCKPSCQDTMGSHLDKYLLPRFGSLPVRAVDEKRVQELISDLSRSEYTKPNGIRKLLSPKSIRNILGVLKLVLGRKVWRD